MAKNEQFAESLTRKLMQFDVGQNEGFYVYPQSIDKSLVAIKECLDKAGGKPKDCSLSEFPTNTKGTGKPEYIITFNKEPNTILVIECKRNQNNHISEDLSHPQKYAVDGVLYYSKYLKDEFNVIAVAVSGTKIDDYSSNAYYWQKGEASYTEIEKTKDILLSPINYLNLLQQKKLVKKFSIEEVKQLASKYNDLMREKLQIQPQERIMFIASCLLALQNDFFAKTYSMATDNLAIVDDIIINVERVLKNNKIADNKVKQICNNATLIKNYQKLIELPVQEEGSLIYFLKQLELVIIPMINNSNSHQDALGIFYHEFIKYTAGSAGKELGIVLTPEHLCDFMCEIVNLNVNDTVIDICCGTGSFLVSAMKHLIAKAKNVEQIKKIKNSQLYGIELQASIYSIVITNMILRGDGQSNIYNEDCFKFKVPEKQEQVNFSVGLLNPPYSQKSEVELKFVKKMLDILNPRGTGVVVVPMSCAIGTKFENERKDLFENHTLKAVFSMPDDIFYPVGTNVCVMVWEAHIPHNSSIPTFFGYYKDDGFIKKKNLGRIDANNKWQNIKNEWIDLYRKNKEFVGKTALQCVTANDEWLCEAYMKTDYSDLQESDFEQTIRNYIAYKIASGDSGSYIVTKYNNINLDINNWKLFKISEIFTSIENGKVFDTSILEEGNDIYYIGAKKENNGVIKRCKLNSKLVSKGNCIAFICDGQGSVGYNNYIPYDFIGTINLSLGYSKYLNQYIGLFLVTILDKERFRFSFGRKRKPTLRETLIKLPATSNNNPDWQFMEDYIKSLPYGDCI